MQVQYKGTQYTTKGYRATKNSDYIEVVLDKITLANMLGELILGGCTFEMFVQLDYPPSQTVGFLTSCNAGGVTLYLRGYGAQMNFQIGTTKPNAISNANYSMVQHGIASMGAKIDGNRVAHVVGTYDKSTNMMNLYYNGVLVAKYIYGNGNFKIGSAIYNKLGIGRNVSSMSEALADQTDYTVLRSRVYFVALTDKQVAAEYYDCIDSLIRDNDVNP